MVSSCVARRARIVSRAVVFTFAATMIVALNAASAFAACTLPSGTTPGACTYSGAGAGLTVTDTGAGAGHGAIEGIGASGNAFGIKGEAKVVGAVGGLFTSTAGGASNANNAALEATNSGGSTTAEGNYGSAGVFQITNAMNQSSGVSIATNGINSYGLKVVNSGTIDGAVTNPPSNNNGGIAGYFEVSSPNALEGQAAIYAIHSGGSTTTNGPYGNAGFLSIKNAKNTDTALYVETFGNGTGFHAETHGAETASAAEGYDYSSVGGTGIFGYSLNGTAAEFIHGTGGTGRCTFDGGSDWNCTSDRNLKEHFAAVDLDVLLDKLDAMPVFYYQMKGSKMPTRYLGPTAQDFKAAFDLGDTDTMINGANAKGVALAAAKGLYRKLKADEAEIAALKQALAEQKAAMADRVARLEATVARLAQGADGMKQASLIAH